MFYRMPYIFPVFYRLYNIFSVCKECIMYFFSALEGQATELDLGDEVEYTLARKSSKLSAENIKKLPMGTIPQNEVSMQYTTRNSIPDIYVDSHLGMSSSLELCFNVLFNVVFDSVAVVTG